MPDLAYGEVYSMNKVKARLHLVKTYEETGSISETARIWHTSRKVVRKWVRRFETGGIEGLEDRSRRPKRMPRKIESGIEAKVMEIRKRYGYGKRRIADILRLEGIEVSENTVRNILRRNLSKEERKRKRKRRKRVYPAHWAWEEGEPFKLLQVDTKDIADKGTLGTKVVKHLFDAHLPRYQWTALEGRSRLRFLAYSHRLNRTNGLAFMILVLWWMRIHGVRGEVEIQTDWGQEFGGSNPERIEELSDRFLAPFGGVLRRYPKGRKGYNGRVERSHRTDDEELYAPCLLKIRDEREFLEVAQRWEYVYNVVRPHQGKGMGGKTPLMVLRELGYDGGEGIAVFPTVLLDEIAPDLLLLTVGYHGDDLLAPYHTHVQNPRNQLSLGCPPSVVWFC